MDPGSDSPKDTILRHIRSMGAVTSAEPAYVSALKNLGLNDDQINLFIVLIQPALIEYLESEFASALTLRELTALSIVADERGFNEDERSQMLKFSYEEKAERQLENTIGQFYINIAGSLVNTIEDLKKILANISADTEKEAKEQFNELIQDIIQK